MPIAKQLPYILFYKQISYVICCKGMRLSSGRIYNIFVALKPHSRTVSVADADRNHLLRITMIIIITKMTMMMMIRINTAGQDMIVTRAIIHYYVFLSFLLACTLRPLFLFLITK